MAIQEPSDMWKQIYAWFDEFLMKPEKAEGTKQ